MIHDGCDTKSNAFNYNFPYLSILNLIRELFEFSKNINAKYALA